MRTNIEIDDTLMAEAQRACGQATKKQTVDQALRLMMRLRQQRDVDWLSARTAGAATLCGAAKGDGSGDCCRAQCLDRFSQWPECAPCPALRAVLAINESANSQQEPAMGVATANVDCEQRCAACQTQRKYCLCPPTFQTECGLNFTIN